MTSTFEQQCPLCKDNAKYEFKNFGNWKHFLCDTCKEFLISLKAENLLFEAMLQWRFALSIKSNSSDEEKIFAITKASVAQTPEGSAHPVLNEEFIERKKLGR